MQRNVLGATAGFVPLCVGVVVTCLVILLLRSCCGVVSRPPHCPDRRSPKSDRLRQFMETFGPSRGRVRRPAHNRFPTPQKKPVRLGRLEIDGPNSNRLFGYRGDRRQPLFLTKKGHSPHPRLLRIPCCETGLKVTLCILHCLDFVKMENCAKIGRGTPPPSHVPSSPSRPQFTTQLERWFQVAIDDRSQGQQHDLANPKQGHPFGHVVNRRREVAAEVVIDGHRSAYE